MKLKVTKANENKVFQVVLDGEKIDFNYDQDGALTFAKTSSRKVGAGELLSVMLANRMQGKGTSLLDGDLKATDNNVITAQTDAYFLKKTLNIYNVKEENAVTEAVVGVYCNAIFNEAFVELTVQTLTPDMAETIVGEISETVSATEVIHRIQMPKDIYGERVIIKLYTRRLPLGGGNAACSTTCQIYGKLTEELSYV